MSWLFSRALVAASLGENSSDGEPSAELSVMPTAHPFWRAGKTMEPFHLSRFGLTCEVLMADRGEAVLTWCLAASRARTLAAQGRAMDSTASGRGSGEKWPEWFARWDRATSSWRTAQCSLFGGLSEFSGTWPAWGWMQDGECSALTVPGWTIPDSDSGLLPTPLASDHKGGHSLDRAATPRTLAGRARAWRDYVRDKYGLTYPHPTHSELRMGWPIEWTASKPLEMDRFQVWLCSHGEC